MIVYFILGLVLIIGAWLMGRWFVASDAKLVIKVLGRFLIGFVLVAVTYLAISGRIGLALLAVPLVLGWGVRFWKRARTSGQSEAPQQGGTSGQTSDIETRYLKLSLDHDSGVTTGEVLTGTYAGRLIDGLSMQELSDLLAVCRQDDQESARVLEAYLIRVYPDWWSRFGADADASANSRRPEATSGGMGTGEAYDILGLNPGCSPDDIKEAHRRLMGALHPDRGGSTYLAAKLNQAKDVLLNP